MLLGGKNLWKRFGGIVALREFEFSIREMEIVGLIGPNGAGKTTLFNVVTGVYPPDSGKIYYNGQEITGKKPHEICKLGISRTYQIPKPFPDNTVLENVMVGALFGRRGRTEWNKALQDSLEALKLVDLIHKKDVEARKLNMIELKRLEMARALVIKPRLLLLDEPLAGLNPTETAHMLDLIRNIRNEWRIGILIIEHVMRAIMAISERIIVMNQGLKIAEGKPEEVSGNQMVIEAYLGQRYR